MLFEVPAPNHDAVQHPDDKIRIYVYNISPVTLLHCFSDGTCAIMSIATYVWLEIMHGKSYICVSVSQLAESRSPTGLRKSTHYGV